VRLTLQLYLCTMQPDFQIPVLLYHRVINSSSVKGKHKIYLDEKKFRGQLTWLTQNEYSTITFRDLDKQNPVSGKKVILTFDDGYYDNYSILFPILKEYDFTAVIFLVTGMKQNEWGIKQGEPALNLLNKDQVREMSDYGIEFGAHTQHHIDLKNTPIEQQREEISGCFADVENLSGIKPISFSYPFGAYNDDTLKLVKESGFRYGITTIFGPPRWEDDAYRIRRLEISPKTSMLSFARKASGRYFSTNWLSYFLTS